MYLCVHLRIQLNINTNIALEEFSLLTVALRVERQILHATLQLCLPLKGSEQIKTNTTNKKRFFLRNTASARHAGWKMSAGAMAFETPSIVRAKQQRYSMWQVLRSHMWDLSRAVARAHNI